MRINHKHFVYINSLPELAWCKQTGLWFILVVNFGMTLQSQALEALSVQESKPNKSEQYQYHTLSFSLSNPGLV